MIESWKPVPGQAGLEVSDQGRVRGRIWWGRWHDQPRVLKAGNHPYPTVHYRRQSLRVHSLVLAAFVGPLPTGAHTRHLDGDPTNNRLDNLTYGTPSENTLDDVVHGRHNNARKTHCLRGHEYSEANTRVRAKSTGGYMRVCLACQNLRNRERAMA